MGKLYEELFGTQFPLEIHYDGKPAALGSLAWEITRTDTQEYMLETHRAEMDDCLSIALDVRRYHDSDTIEYFATLENASKYDTKIISNIDIAHFHLAFDANTTPFFLDYNGSNEQLCDFMEHRTQLFHRAGRTLRCDGGRSSSKVMPYFQVLMEGYGYTMAIGWSGQWRGEFLRPNDDGILCVRAGMEDAHFRLYPGEKVTLPHMLVQRCEGDEADVFNGYRRFAQRHVVPKRDGKLIKAPVTLGIWGGLTTERHMQNIEMLKKVDTGIETYWIDAGWYGDVQPNNLESDGTWYTNVGIGDWQPSRALYPNGMEEVASAVHEAGMGFLLWFEPERCRASAERVTAHPDWYVGVREEHGDMMLDLGNKEALAWITGVIGDAVGKYHMDVLRIDFNYGPKMFWDFSDKPDRKGISELRYVAGFYKMWDDLLEKYPWLTIDNCASGGRRLDFEALRRSIPLFRTDYSCFGLLGKPEAHQLQTYYLSRFLPVNSTQVHFSTQDSYLVRSGIAGGMSVGGMILNGDEAAWKWCKPQIELSKRMREYTSADLWPLTGASFSELDWMAYQLNQEEKGEGVIIAYRRARCGLRLMDAQLRGIDKDATYVLEDADLGVLGEVSGSELIEGWPLEIKEKRSCRIVFYRRVES